MYPGKGEGYNRHKDAFSTPPSTAAKKDAKDCEGSVTSQPLSRQLTCLLYLNEAWVPEHGGQLRVFTHPGVHVEKGDDPFSFWGVNGYDINPLFGRLIVFRSELVEHAVLPCFQERMALTFWVNGTGPEEEESIESSASVFKFDADAPKPMISKQRENSEGDSGSESDSSDSSSSSSEDENDKIEMLYEATEQVEVKVNGLWVDGTVTEVSNSRYTVVTASGATVTNKGRFEVRPPGPKHSGCIRSKTACEHDWVAFRARWRDMSEEERGAGESVLFGGSTWSCCGGEWNAPPCARR